MTDKLYGHMEEAHEMDNNLIFDHIIAMTAEDLNGKGKIACELAWRDNRIAELEDVANDLRDDIADMEECGDISPGVITR